MDDIVVRSRYPRHSVSNKKRKRYAGEKSSLNTLIVRQLFVSLLILAVAFAVKYVNTPVADGIKAKIQYALTQDIDLKSIYESISNSVSQMWNKTLPGDKSSQSDKSTDQSDKSTERNDKSAVSNGPDAIEASVISNGNAVNGVAGTDGSVVILTVPAKGTLSSTFGERIDSGTRKIHEGIDIEAEKGDPIKAALAGIVLEARNSKSYGEYVKIKHQSGLITVYAHCSLISVTEGQEVKQGETIAEVGNTGVSRGNHLHFEIWKNGEPVDPLKYVSISKE